MIKVKMTEGLGGFQISGDWNDLNELYDSFDEIILTKDQLELDEETKYDFLLDDRIYAFLYDVRKAYSGNRDIFEDKYTSNTYYAFNYSLPEMIDLILVSRHLINRRHIDNILNDRIYNIKSFEAKVLNSLEPKLTHEEFNKVIKDILKFKLNEEKYIPQWCFKKMHYYLVSNPSRRKKKMAEYIDYFTNYRNYEEYDKLYKEVYKFYKEHKLNCIEDVEYDDTTYPANIRW